MRCGAVRCGAARTRPGSCLAWTIALGIKMDGETDKTDNLMAERCLESRGNVDGDEKD